MTAFAGQLRRRADSHTSTVVILILLIVVALMLGLFVQRSVTQIRDALAQEVLQQQHDVANLLHEYARVMIALERARNGSDEKYTEVTAALTAANNQLEKMRFQYSFERLDGAATAHAFVKPVLEDVEQWMDQGIYTLRFDDPLVIEIAARRMRERHSELRGIADDADRVASALIEEQAASLDQFRKSLLGMLALAELFWLGIIVLLIRQRNLESRLRIDSQQHAQRITDFADLGSDVFWETNDQQKLQLFSGPALASSLPAPSTTAHTLPADSTQASVIDSPSVEGNAVNSVSNTVNSSASSSAKKADKNAANKSVVINDGDSDQESATHSNEFVSRLPMQSLLSELPFINHELSWQSAAGDKRLLSVTGKPLYNDDGEFLGYRGVGRDITQRKRIESELEKLNAELLEAQKKGRRQAEQALKDSEQFLRSSLDALTANVAILNTEGIVIATNRAWSEFASSPIVSNTVSNAVSDTPGKMPVEATDNVNTTSRGDSIADANDTDSSIGVHYLQIFKMRSDAEYQAVKQVAEKITGVLAASSEQFNHEFGCNHSGEMKWYSIQLSTFRTNNAQFAVLVHDDVTERRELEERDRRLRAELAHTDRLSTAGEMASGLAHELNQPLTAISHNCDALLYAIKNTSLPQATLSDTLQDIYEQAQRAGHIIHSMRQMAQKESVVSHSVDINTLVVDTVRLGRQEAYEHLIDVKLDLASQLPAVNIDAVQIQQVLLNLERNAIDAIRQGQCDKREITISTSYEDDAVCVRVEDSGPGIDPLIAGKLFTSFQTTKAQGMGMGLSISRTIIEAHGGHLWVEANEPGRTVFSFTLPVMEEQS